MTIHETLAEGTRRLRRPRPSCHVDSPALDAALLLAEALGTDRAGLIIRAPEPAPEDKRRAYEALLERRLSGESVAYIRGRREFRGLDFAVGPAVLVPRPDTEILVEAALDRVDEMRERGSGLSVLELCTGSGAVAISMKHERPGLLVTATDISPAALAVARENAARLLADRLLAAPLPFIQSDLFEKVPGSFDLILANPPYVPSAVIGTLAPEVRGEPLLALDGGVDGLDLIRRIIREGPAHLKNGGRLMLEAESRQIDTITGLLKAAGFRDIALRKDLSGRERVIEGKFIRDCLSLDRFSGGGLDRGLRIHRIKDDREPLLPD